MLKIKDGIDLKELDKYGFKGGECVFSGEGFGESSIEVDTESREIRVYWENYSSDRAVQYASIEVTILFDLITDGLVEKVD